MNGSKFATLSVVREGVLNSGAVTAGNSSQTSDGAGALTLDIEAASSVLASPLVRFVGYASRGTPPYLMGTAWWRPFCRAQPPSSTPCAATTSATAWSPCVHSRECNLPVPSVL